MSKGREKIVTDVLVCWCAGLLKVKFIDFMGETSNPPKKSLILFIFIATRNPEVLGLVPKQVQHKFNYRILVRKSSGIRVSLSQHISTLANSF